MEIDKEYIILQTEYHKINADSENVFPGCWYNVKEYELKKQILKECIKNNILIKDCKLYNDFRLIAYR